MVTKLKKQKQKNPTSSPIALIWVIFINKTKLFNINKYLEFKQKKKEGKELRDGRWRVQENRAKDNSDWKLINTS